MIPAIVTSGALVVENGSHTVIGIGTAWSTQLDRGTIIKVGEAWGIVASRRIRSTTTPDEIETAPAGAFVENDTFQLVEPWDGETTADEINGETYVAVVLVGGAEINEQLIRTFTALRNLGLSGVLSEMPSDLSLVPQNTLVYDDTAGILTILRAGEMIPVRVVSQPFNPRDAWDVEAVYQRNDLVTREGFAFVSAQDDNVGHEPMWDPPDSNQWWVLVSASGPAGISVGMDWNYSDNTNTTMSPGMGNFRTNNADPSLATQVVIHNETADEGNPDVGAMLASWALSDAPVKGWLKVVRKTNPEQFLIYTVTDIAVAGAGAGNRRLFTVDPAHTVSAGGMNGVANITFIPNGLVGPAIELRTDGGFVQWRPVGGSEWANLVALAAITGEPELRATDTHIQWRVAGSETWNNLIAINDLPRGPQGQGIDPDATGTLEARDDYSDEPEGFVFLQTDVIPFRLHVMGGGGSGDWSDPSPIAGASTVNGIVPDIDGGVVVTSANIPHGSGTVEEAIGAIPDPVAMAIVFGS